MITRAAQRLICAGAAIGAGVMAFPADAQDQTGAAPQRPAIMFNRWQEDWSVLADPLTPREPFDALKYIPLSTTDSKVYLSFGGGLRERFEGNDAENFGVGTNHTADYVISRLEVNADLRLGPAIQVFTQLESAFAPGKNNLTPVDQDRLDLEQAFIALSEPLGEGRLKLRVGRQEIAFDLQRFVGVRDGPNIRQSYDAVWADYERGPWRLLGFFSLPVQYRDLRAFDSYSSDHLTYGGVRLERRFGSIEASVSYSNYTQDNAHFTSVKGNERRDILDIHGSGAENGFDWDAEFMGQTGRIGIDDIQAWAVGSVSGYTFKPAPWSPRLGLQIDAASGDSNPNDHRLGTFNPLFPNGYYLTLAGYTGYVNFIHVKPSVTLHPTKALKLMIAGAAQWRETTADAVYTQPNIPVAGTAGRGGDWTGSYGQVRTDYAFNSHLSGAIEVVHFSIGEAIRQAGGHDSNYCGVELKLGW
jgi:hypothetical protein